MNKDFRRRIWRAAGTAAAVVTVFCSAPVSALAADLKPETLQEWDEYVKPWMSAIAGISLLELPSLRVIRIKNS
jgi:hypothetical protein